MKHSLILALALFGMLAGNSANAQTLVDSWTYAGGGLNPATYGGNNKPTTITADAAASNGAVIDIVGTQSSVAGLGLAGEAYEGYYTFTSNLSFSVSSGTILSGAESISFSFYSYSYIDSSLQLDYNGSDANLSADNFEVGDEVEYYVAAIDLTVTLYQYTWTWDVSALGPITDFTIDWTVPVDHNFMTDFSLVQVVPEPSVAGLLVFGAGACLLRRRRDRVRA